MMTLVEIVGALAKNVGIPVPDSVVSSSDRSLIEALRYANETGDEIARRVDWGALYKTAAATGTGSGAAVALPDDFDRIPQGVAVTYKGATVRPLTRAEWTGLTPKRGAPRYFLLESDRISFFPYLASGDTASVGYISTDWASGGAGFEADADTQVFPDDLFIAGLIVRWRRQKGMDYADFEAEYEAMLSDYARFSDRSRF